MPSSHKCPPPPPPLSCAPPPTAQRTGPARAQLTQWVVMSACVGDWRRGVAWQWGLSRGRGDLCVLGGRASLSLTCTGTARSLVLDMYTYSPQPSQGHPSHHV